MRDRSHQAFSISRDYLLRRDIRFEAPEDKPEKLEAIPTEAVTSDVITFRMLEKMAGKCTSLSVAVAVAGLYTHHMYIFNERGYEVV